MGDFFSYNFVNISGNDNNQFFLTGNELRTSTIFDFESKNYYLIYLQSTDSRGTSITRQFIINVTDSNDKPTAIQLSNNSIAENLPSGTFIGLLTSTDPDQSSNFNYQLAGGPGANDNSSFRIANDSLLSNVVFNFESKKTFSIRLRTVDNTNEFFDQQFTLEVSDANDAPNSIGISSTSLAENSAVNTMVGILNTVDIDADDTHTYQLVSGTGSTDNALFNIENDKITSNFVADFELKSSYSIRVQSKDKSGDSIERSITINIADKSEKPSILNQSFNISENSLINDVVGTISASSPDAGANLIFTWAANTTSTFSLNETTGQITVANNLDYEKRRLYVLTIVVKDDQTVPQYDTATITINVIDEIESKQTLPANNYMSPNGDGLNDLFVIENVQLYADYSLTIYNEANIEVFKVLSNYNNDWDGTFNNKQLPTGVYFYVFRNPKNGAEFKGSLNILKQ
ncbi:MAG: hypothetical protein EAY81_06650 [Bacteroidetes bacterium]|nr:MAG: hypothetical protein EAY81_06650 [Bacteroidota bacterium]